MTMTEERMDQLGTTPSKHRPNRAGHHFKSLNYSADRIPEFLCRTLRRINIFLQIPFYLLLTKEAKRLSCWVE